MNFNIFVTGSSYPTMNGAPPVVRRTMFCACALHLDVDIVITVDYFNKSWGVHIVLDETNIAEEAFSDTSELDAWQGMYRLLVQELRNGALYGTV